VKNITQLKGWICFLIFVVCVGGYLIGKKIISNKLVEKQIVYASKTASEVEIVWGLLDCKLPTKELWPQNTIQKNGVLHTKLNARDTVFITTISLPAESTIYYWMVQKKGKSGNPIEIWDSGVIPKLTLLKLSRTPGF
jgi:hypothetical protein